MLDLCSLPRRYFDALGADKVADITATKKAVVLMWMKTGKFPLVAIQRLLEFDPTPIHEIKPLYTIPEAASRLMILLPTNRPIAAATMDTVLPMFNQKEMQYKRVSFNSLYHVRNMLAAAFLASPCEWSWWSDDDMIHPCGDAALFKRLLTEHTAATTPYPEVFAAAHSIYRLRYHQKKLIGACYFGRKQGVPGQFAGAGAKEMRENLRRGPREKIMEVDWVGFGSTLVHRDVFTDIIKTHGDKIRVTNEYIKKTLGYEYSFFMPLMQDWGDDQSFCSRAKEAGHQTWVDLSLMPAHVGMKAFTFADQ